MQEVTRKEGESFDNLLRRFNKRVSQSGVLMSARKNMYHEKPISKREQREQAIRKRARKKTYE